MMACSACSLAAGMLFAMTCALPADADERVSVCFNYECLAQAEVVFSDAQLLELKDLLGRAQNPAQEREAVGEAVGRLFGWAGRQSPISADRGGNYADDAAYGRMDCIDHATTATRLLRLMERRGLLRFHRVAEPVRRHRFLIFQHDAAQIEEIESGNAKGADGEAPAFVVDSWFFDNGHPAAVMPLIDWMAGETPDGA
jgi:hypothetical protein